jgi:nucleotide-binding universal stress UspA family protein
MTKEPLEKIQRILIAVDDSEASAKEVDYVVEMIGDRPASYLHLVHVLPPGIEAESFSEAAPSLVRQAKDEAREILEKMRERVCARGFDAEHVDVGVLGVSQEVSLADGLIDAARAQSCSTVVVGRNSLPWYREAFHHHPADELVKHAHGLAVWIVE